MRRIFKAAEEIRRGLSATDIKLGLSMVPFPSGSILKVSRGPLSSGEGLIYAIRDKVSEEDPGVADKRLLVVEAELGAALRAFQRNGNNLSMVLRTLYDGDTVEPLTKNNRISATDPHVSIIGHITRQELTTLLSANDVWGGLGNRFWWLCARRPKLVALPQPMDEGRVNEIASRLARAVALAHSRAGEELVMSNAAQDYWVNIYPELTQDHPGILGAVTSRMEVHARRLALTYAQLDCADRIEIVHMEAALTFCRYAFDSAAYLFTGVEMDPIAQKIVEALASGPKPQNDMVNLFDRHLSKERLGCVLTDLQDRGRITLTVEKTGGRPRKVWSLVARGFEKSEGSEKNERSDSKNYEPN